MRKFKSLVIEVDYKEDRGSEPYRARIGDSHFWGFYIVESAKYRNTYWGKTPEQAIENAAAHVPKTPTIVGVYNLDGTKF